MSTPFAYTGTVRAGGADRYETAAVIFRGSFAPSAGSTAFLAGGESFADALAAGPAAAGLDGPLLPTATVDRTAGADRYATATAVAKRFFPAGQASFVLARGDAFPDAVSGAALAGRRGEPLLLTAPNALPSTSPPG